MSEQQPGRPADEKRTSRLDEALRKRAQSRRDKIRAEIARNRGTDHRVPTWVMALALVVILGGWLWLIFTS